MLSFDIHSLIILPNFQVTEMFLVIKELSRVFDAIIERKIPEKYK